MNAANPRPDNHSGHIIEITEDGDDATATRFTWDVFLLAGDPGQGRYIVDARELAAGNLGRAGHLLRGLSAIAPMSREVHCPDNLGIDPQGRLWIVTDTDDRGHPNNGCFVVPDQRARSAACCSSSPAARSVAKSAAANSRPTAARCSCPSSIRAKAARSTSRAVTGRMATGCRRGPRCWPSSARTASRFDIVSRLKSPFSSAFNAAALDWQP